jgi:eukaryotic-like serine/threonine-protein kinase
MQPRTTSPNKPDATQWQRALTLLDRVLEKTATERAPLLAEIETAEPEITPLLRKLLAAQARIETRDFLSTLPKTASLNIEAGTTNARIGPFLLIEQIGSGGMGSVWKARYADENIKREVAVKLPALSADSTQSIRLRERFARERDFLAQLEHANIARLYDAGISEAGHPYLALEYVRGERIDEHCDAKKLSIDERLQLFLQALDAVEFAHRQLVLHRDIKPGNILVDGQGNVKLLDFGVAKLLPNRVDAPTKNDNLTELVGTAITLAYAAPEQIVNGPLSTATDVYALGVVLFKLLTGSAPYAPSRDTRGALEEAVINALPPTLSSVAISEADASARRHTPAQLRQRLRGDLEVIVAKALRKNVAERYPTAAAFGDDLRRALANEPITARPQTLSYRANRLFARHKVAVMASALGLSALVGTTGVAVWQASVANANAARATKEAQRVLASQRFMAGLFANADPEKTKQSSEAAREILERGLTTAERELADDPETLNLVFGQIGDIHYRLGQSESNLAVQQRRVGWLQTRQSAVDPNTLVEARIARGLAMRNSSDPSMQGKATMDLAEVEAHASSEEKVSAELKVWSIAVLADQYRNDGKLEIALGIATRALSLGREALPNPSPKLAGTLHIISLVNSGLGRLDEARAQLHEAVAIDRTGKGRSRVDEIDATYQLARIEYLAGNYLEARKQSYAILDYSTSTFGDIGGNLAPARRTAVFASERAGDLASAERDLRELLLPEFSAKEPSRVGSARFAQARIEVSRKLHSDAQKTIDSARPLFESDLFWRVRLEILNAENLLLQGGSNAIVETLNPIVEKDKTSLGVLSNEVASIYELLAIANARLGGMELAQNQIGKSCKIRSETRVVNHPQRVRCDAYAVMLSSTLTPNEKAVALNQFALAVGRNRNDNIALVPSLYAAKNLYAQATQDSASKSQFPILD